MRKFEGILLTHKIDDVNDRAKEKKRLKAYLRGDYYFRYKGRTFFVDPSLKPNRHNYSGDSQPIVPEIQI